MTDPSELAPAAAIVQHQVRDFDEWKAGFDAHEDMRRGVGILGHHINRARDDANNLGVFLALSDLDRAKEFAGSDELRETMQKLGVVSQPNIAWMTPVREDIVWDRSLPAFIISHAVADFDAWLQGYDGAHQLQMERGIVGHAANRSIDDPNRVTVYHQAESFETLENFLADPDLKEAMEAAGVSSPPEVSYHTGGWAKLY